MSAPDFLSRLGRAALSDVMVKKPCHHMRYETLDNFLGGDIETLYAKCLDCGAYTVCTIYLGRDCEVEEREMTLAEIAHYAPHAVEHEAHRRAS